MEQVCLMLGAGHGQCERRIFGPYSAPNDATEWITLDNNKAAKPDLLYDLNELNYRPNASLPIESEAIDEIHAYEVLEHFGEQGDYKGFFNTFKEFWRVLKPGGLFMGTTPWYTSEWAWADPGHTRVITPGTFAFLTREHYKQLGKTASSDYTALVDPCWWEQILGSTDNDYKMHQFVLKKVL